MSFGLLPTALHLRTAEHNRDNAWVARGVHMLPAHYGDPKHEALTARFSSVLADVSAIQELRIEGAGAALLLATACGRAARTLSIGRFRPVHWTAEGGGLRGAGVLMRSGENVFLLRSADADFAWFATPAPRFGATVLDATAMRGLLLLAGPYAEAILSAVGLVLPLDADEHRDADWGGVAVSLCREPRLNGYLISAKAEDSILVFDRLLRAGQPFGLHLAGQEAVETLQLEAGIVLPHIDFVPARAQGAQEPFAASLGFGAGSPERILAGVQFDSDETHPFAPLFHERKEVGRTLRSATSFSLKRGIALAQIEPAFAQAGTRLNLRSGRDASVETIARVVALPFL